MSYIDIDKINKNINNAYDNQTEKVKKLFEDAQKKLDVKDNKECYTVKNKETVKHVYNLNRTISKNKEFQKNIEKRIDTKLEEMIEKINLNSSNLDFIFDKVSNNSDKQIELIKDLADKQQISVNKSIEKLHNKNKKLYKDEQSELENKILNSQEMTFDKILEEQKNIQLQLVDIINERQEKLENIITDNNKENEIKILNIQNNIEQKIEGLQKQYEQDIYDLKQDMKSIYSKENKYSINYLLEERLEYLKQLDEKDKQIRDLNYKINVIEEKLQKEKEKKHKFSIWSIFFKDRQYEEEEVVYTSQILTYRYQQ